ncbi:right-handed parallel beta-helix repeat-containing protein [Larkinella knui]|uniref:Right-handed parallel beta-helix repeat-containing protein n=1 Tax=Larkinella knui TaxID=2025310 RepID=A0A3P1CNG3_9BACT|nr:right-handed parallel beta-helix repeat-containing protein [Larkinella knui]RRB14867.1 right-handed parallel beta-helix repeat-containing protein [Larkinella knui]
MDNAFISARFYRAAGLVFFGLAVCLTTVATPIQHKFYVSPQGTDAGAGTLKKPFRTIQRAQQEVRRYTSAQTGDVVIYLMDGTYPLAEPLRFSTADGGQGSGRVIYQAYPNAKPVLTGGQRITGWVPDRNGIFKASVKGLDFRQLYVNDRRAIRARKPDAGAYYRLSGWDVRSRSLMMKAHYVDAWKAFDQVEAVVQMFWADTYVHLKAFEKFRGGPDMAYVSIRDHEAAILFPRPYPYKQDDAAFHFENAYEFVNQPGEWYLDRVSEMLFYQPEKYQNIQDLTLMAPVTETLLQIEGTLDAPVRNLHFIGLTFEHSNWNRPSSDGYINSQAGMYSLTADTANNQTVRRPASAIRVSNATAVVFEKNTFQHLGATAVDLESGTQACRLVGNLIRDCSGTGVMIGAFTKEKDGEFHLEPYHPTDRREICTNDEVMNNYITRVGQDYYGTCGIAAGYPAGLKIEHNVIRDLPYSGISLGFGWTGKENAMRDNRIAFNDISHVMNLLCDGGAIYTLSRQPGTQISDNYIHDIQRSKWAGSWPIAAIYLDQASGGSPEKPLLIEHNTFLITDPLVRPFNLNMEGRVQFSNNGTDRAEVIKNAGIQENYKPFIDLLLQQGPVPDNRAKR